MEAAVCCVVTLFKSKCGVFCLGVLSAKAGIKTGVAVPYLRRCVRKYCKSSYANKTYVRFVTTEEDTSRYDTDESYNLEWIKFKTT